MKITFFLKMLIIDHSQNHYTTEAVEMESRIYDLGFSIRKAQIKYFAFLVNYFLATKINHHLQQLDVTNGKIFTNIYDLMKNQQNI